MSTLGRGDGTERSPEDRPEGLRGLPPDWGTVVVPDDPSELAQEADDLRRQLRRSSRRVRWRRRFGLTERPGEPTVAVPLMIMALAVIGTLTSLFAVAWPKPQGYPPPDVPATVAVANLTLIDAQGQQVRLRETAPAVILLVDGCTCGGLLAETATTAAPAVAVLAVGRAVPPLANAPAGVVGRVRPLADPAGTLRSALALPSPSGLASVLLISRSGQLTRSVPVARQVDEFRRDLERIS